MGNQFKTLIDLVNVSPKYVGFTTRDMKSKTEKTVKPTAVNSFISTAFRMGVLARTPIMNPGRGPKLRYTILRPFTKVEATRLTSYPDCIEFKKEIDAAFKTSQKKLSVKVEGVKVTHSPDKAVFINNHKDKTVITIFK